MEGRKGGKGEGGGGRRVGWGEWEEQEICKHANIVQQALFQSSLDSPVPILTWGLGTRQ